MATGSVWAVGDCMAKDRANQKMILIDTGDNILVVDVNGGGQPDQLAIATNTSSNFTQNHFYCRKSTNDGWYSIQTSGTDLTLAAAKVVGTS